MEFLKCLCCDERKRSGSKQEPTEFFQFFLTSGMASYLAMASPISLSSKERQQEVIALVEVRAIPQVSLLIIFC